MCRQLQSEREGEPWYTVLSPADYRAGAELVFKYMDQKDSLLNVYSVCLMIDP